ncbi:MAG: hypothetical protein ACI92E_001653 [Oceanicoccus sp.]|jgi:hypothetical protein
MKLHNRHSDYLLWGGGNPVVSYERANWNCGFVGCGWAVVTLLASDFSVLIAIREINYYYCSINISYGLLVLRFLSAFYPVFAIL